MDLTKLMVMRRLIATGVSASEAAVSAKSFKGKAKIENIDHQYKCADDLVNAIHKAAQRFDTAFIESELVKNLAEDGVIATWTQVIAPVLYLIGKDWEDTGKGIEVEHLLTEILKRILRESVDNIENPLNARPVLIAAVGEELHCLALHALAAALAERRIQTYFLGSRTPFEAIAGMVSRSAPPAIFLWAQLEENAQPEFFRELPAVRPAPRIVLGGPGWDRDACTGVVLVEDLAQACLEIERAVGL